MVAIAVPSLQRCSDTVILHTLANLVVNPSLMPCAATLQTTFNTLCIQSMQLWTCNARAYLQDEQPCEYHHVLSRMRYDLMQMQILKSAKWPSTWIPSSMHYQRTNKGIALLFVKENPSALAMGHASMCSLSLLLYHLTRGVHCSMPAALTYANVFVCLLYNVHAVHLQSFDKFSPRIILLTYTVRQWRQQRQPPWAIPPISPWPTSSTWMHG